MMNIVSWDGNNINDGTNYTAWFPAPDFNPRGLHAIEPQMALRTGYWPIIGGIQRPGHRLVIKILIEGASVDALRVQLLQWFRPYPPRLNIEKAPVKQLVIEDDDGSNDRYVEAVCISCLPDMTVGADLVFTAILQVHGDVRWRSTSDSSFSTWNLVFDSGINNLNPDGEDEVYPVIQFTPGAGKTGSYAYKRFIPLRWVETSYGAQNYPVDITNDSFDTAALISSKMQADGDDLRVFVNGTEKDRWLDGINTSTTKVWVNLDFLPNVEMTLASAIASSGSVDSITVNEDISGVYAPGIVQIDSEYFQFTGKIPGEGILTGVTRAAHGSSAAAHSVGADAYWIQNEIYIAYGDSGAAAPTTDDNYKPIFDLSTSTNTSWVYTDFGETLTTGIRAASWVKASNGGQPFFYTANRNTNASPWSEMGIGVTNQNGTGQTGSWQLYNPCGITNANFTNGEKYGTDTGADHALARIESFVPGAGWNEEYEIPNIAAASTWEAWSQSVALDTGAISVRMLVSIYRLSPLDLRQLEVADCTLTLNSSNTPVTSIGAEQGGYLLDVTLTNLYFKTSALGGIQTRITFLMELNETLEVDTYNKTITYLKDGSSQMQALTLIGPGRNHWFPLEGGQSNELSAADTGTTDLDIDISYTPRHLT